MTTVSKDKVFTDYSTMKFENIEHVDLAYLVSYVYYNPYNKYEPFKEQLLALIDMNHPVTGKQYSKTLLGGSGYSGKSVLGSMAAVRFLELGSTDTLVTRETLKELKGPTSIWDNLQYLEYESVMGKDHVCDINRSDYVITSPTGSRIYFRSFDRPEMRKKIKGESYQCIINEESAEMHPKTLKFLFRSLRYSNHVNRQITLSMLNLTNPTDNIDSNQYHIDEYIEPTGNGTFIRSDYLNNPHADPEYGDTLDELDDDDRMYQKEGDFYYKPQQGDFISRKEIEACLDIVSDDTHDYRAIGIDFAGEGSDYTTATCLDYKSDGYKDNIKVVNRDMMRTQSSEPENQLLDFISLYEPDAVYCEQEPGSQYDKKYWRIIFKPLKEEFGFILKFIKVYRSKYQRARTLINYHRKKRILIDENNYREYLGNKTKLELLINEFLSLRRESKEMKKSPDIVDSYSVVFNKLFKTYLRPDKISRKRAKPIILKNQNRGGII
ncbi:MAG: phage terminase large subunit [Methanobrevibacter sp.]|jgi:hypothetical protein|nr:phage terminase large subunit [Candidatus Methanovirga australis]